MADEFKISLRAARVNANLTQTEAARRLGIGVNTLIKWEKDPGCIPGNRAQLIGKAYLIDPARIDFLRKD